MSIASEITALQTDKTNIANAITAKGGTVSSGDGFDDFSAAIAGIPTASTGTEITLTADMICSCATALSAWEDLIGDMSDVIALIATTEAYYRRHVVQWYLLATNHTDGTVAIPMYVWESRASGGSTATRTINCYSTTATGAPMEWFSGMTIRIVREGELIW